MLFNIEQNKNTYNKIHTEHENFFVVIVKLPS